MSLHEVHAFENIYEWWNNQISVVNMPKFRASQSLFPPKTCIMFQPFSVLKDNTYNPRKLEKLHTWQGSCRHAWKILGFAMISLITYTLRSESKFSQHSSMVKRQWKVCSHWVFRKSIFWLHNLDIAALKKVPRITW